MEAPTKEEKPEYKVTEPKKEDKPEAKVTEPKKEDKPEAKVEGAAEEVPAVKEEKENDGGEA